MAIVVLTRVWLTLAVVAAALLADRPNRRSVVTRVHKPVRTFVLPWRVWRSRRGPTQAGSFGSPMSRTRGDASLDEDRVCGAFGKSFGGKT